MIVTIWLTCSAPRPTNSDWSCTSTFGYGCSAVSRSLRTAAAVGAVVEPDQGRDVALGAEVLRLGGVDQVVADQLVGLVGAAEGQLLDGRTGRTAPAPCRRA